MTLTDDEFFEKIPKIELHAHLNGSLSLKTMKKLQQHHQALGRLGKDYPLEEFFIQNGTKNLEDCFKLFPIAQSLTVDTKSVYIATQETILEFYKDNCIYLELRSTPRDTEFMTKEEYIKAMIDAVLPFKNKNDIIVKLVISIDRRMDVESAAEIVALAKKYGRNFDDVVVGIDVSGDPTAGSFNNFRQLLDTAREEGLKITIHCAEVSSHKETLDILDWRPERLGHAVCIHQDFGGNEDLWRSFLESKIPVEVCLTSNVKTQSVTDYNEHHVTLLRTCGHPFVLGTDDKGVFDTSLSKELRHLSDILKLTRRETVDFVSKSCQHIFGQAQEMKILLAKIEDFAKEHLQDGI